MKQNKRQQGKVDESWNQDEKLLNAYLWDDHPLHVRRSLDQYYYHTLKDTSARDSQQVVSRFQKANSLNPRVLTVVDQLWMWVLVGADGHADKVITCFPQICSSQDDMPNSDRDVLQQIKTHLQTEPTSVKTAYDLAGLIASKCSRAYLDLGSRDRRLQFSEIYEMSIGEVVSVQLGVGLW